ncbi:hypothetical protein SAMN04487996_11137 [Dyadobacter soli]|uniref:Uncharacterized protein n=1 Tax=Dyadobacter soli TaxID=659014 RepID=A0A1G7LNB2_9BACT|nr:hypothetical protein [Dyadobacter soli]SDF51012.1 hypothetical protein SAMN04487996_11137 [Dyadobacter soli]
MVKPIGISEFQLTEAIPKNLKSSLPSIKALEKEINTPKNRKARDEPK